MGAHREEGVEMMTGTVFRATLAKVSGPHNPWQHLPREGSITMVNDIGARDVWEGDTLLRDLIAYLEENCLSEDGLMYVEDSNEILAKVVLTLVNGTVLRGTIVTPKRFGQLNQAGVVEPREDEEGEGSWPVGFEYDPQDEETRRGHVHLDDVEFLSGGKFEHGCTKRVGIEVVLCCGERS
jgi:hypothetical protein